MKKLLFLVAVLAMSNVDAMSAGRDFFGGKSSGDLIGQIKGSNSTACVVKSSIADTNALLQLQESMIGQPTFVEKPCSGFWGWLGRTEWVKVPSSMSAEAQVAAKRDLTGKVQGLEAVSRCLNGFQTDLKISEQTVQPYADSGDILGISQNGASNGRDYNVASDVNKALARPYENLEECVAPLRHTTDIVVAQARSEALQLVDAGKEYNQNIKLIEQARADYDKLQAKIDREHERAKLEEWCGQQGSHFDCFKGSAKLYVGDACDWTAEKYSSVYDWTANGWKTAGTKAEQIKADLMSTDWNKQWETVRDFGTSPENYGIENAVVQGGKGLVAVAVTFAALWALYKAGKITLSALRGFWNMSKKAKLATVLTLGAAVAVTPSAVMAASAYMQ